jgi:hypothetical protein
MHFTVQGNDGSSDSFYIINRTGKSSRYATSYGDEGNEQEIDQAFDVIHSLNSIVAGMAKHYDFRRR